MDATFYEWLKTVRREDKNMVHQIDETRKLIKSIVLAAIAETDGCKCDECILRIIAQSEQKHLLSKLQLIGLEYILGENFNGAAALYYGAFIKESSK